MFLFSIASKPSSFHPMALDRAFFDHVINRSKELVVFYCIHLGIVKAINIYVISLQTVKALANSKLQKFLVMLLWQFTVSYLLGAIHVIAPLCRIDQVVA